MLQAITVVVLLYFVVLSVRSWNSAGVALGLAWSLYVMEQLLQQSVPVLLQHKYLVNVIVSLAVTMAATNVVFRGRIAGIVKESGIPPQLVTVFLLLGLCGISWIWSISRGHTTQQILLHLPYLLVFVVVTPICATDRGAITSAVDVTVKFGGLLLLGLAFSNFGSRGIVLELYNGTRLNEGNPLEIGSYGAMVTLSVSVLLYCKKRTFVKQVFLLTVAGLGVYATVRSQSRGQLVALVVSLMIWLPLLGDSVRVSSRVLAVLTAVGLSVFVFLAMREMQLLDRWQGDNLRFAGDTRLSTLSTLWSAYMKAGLVVWLVGLGSSASFHLSQSYPHNIPVEVLCELGIVGLALLLTLIVRTFVVGRRLLRTPGLSPAARINIGILLAMFTFHGLLILKQGSLLGSAYFLSFSASLAWVIPRYSATLDGRPMSTVAPQPSLFQDCRIGKGPAKEG